MGYASDNDDDRIWNEAMDWLLRINAQPEDQSTKAALAAWLATSDAHAAAFAEARAIWDLTGRVSYKGGELSVVSCQLSVGEQVPEFGVRSLESENPQPAIRPPPPLGGNPQSRGRRRAVLGIGVSALAACLAVFFLPALVLQLTADYVTQVGETQVVMLDDGTRISLSTGSALRVSYTPEQRQVELLAGEAFFTVTPDPARAFLVRADRGIIRVLGTAFQVRLDQPTLSIAVQKGEVSVSRDLPAAEKEVLRKGQALQLDLATGAAQRQQVTPDQIAAWRDGRLIVENWTVSEAINEIARYHRGMIMLTDDALAQKPISGVYDLQDPVAAVKAIVQPYAATVWELTPYVLIVSGR
jgi:transmembrane sensor